MLGYTVTARTSSVQAFQIFRTRAGDFDLIITDYTMPKLTGLELAREVRRRLTIIAVAVVCGLAGREILGR